MHAYFDKILFNTFGVNYVAECLEQNQTTEAQYPYEKVNIVERKN